MNSLPSNYISEDEAKRILEPHLSTLTNCIKTAWQQWEGFDQEAPDLRFPLAPRTRACFIYDHICHEIKHQFEGKSGVTIDDKLGFLFLNIENLLLMRFKKLNTASQASNIPTIQQDIYNLQLELPGIPNSAARISAGYLLDKIQATIKDIRVAFPVGRRGRKVLWSFSILGTRLEAVQPEMEFGEPAKPKVRAKGVVQEKRKTSGQ
jgi:hypothetical protein